MPVNAKSLVQVLLRDSQIPLRHRFVRNLASTVTSSAVPNNSSLLTTTLHSCVITTIIYRGADKYLARPGRKKTTETKLGIYSTHSPRISIHFLARCSNFCKPLKKKSEGCQSNQVSAAAMTSALREKWRTFNCFFFQSRK